MVQTKKNSCVKHFSATYAQKGLKILSHMYDIIEMFENLENLEKLFYYAKMAENLSDA